MRELERASREHRMLETAGRSRPRRRCASPSRHRFAATDVTTGTGRSGDAACGRRPSRDGDRRMDGASGARHIGGRRFDVRVARGQPPRLLGDPSAQRLRLEELAAGPDGQDLGRDLVRPVELHLRPEPAVRIRVVEPLDRVERPLADDAAEAVEPVAGDAEDDLDARRVALVGRARFGPERRQVEALRPFEDAPRASSPGSPARRGRSAAGRRRPRRGTRRRPSGRARVARGSDRRSCRRGHSRSGRAGTPRRLRTARPGAGTASSA